MSPTNFYARQNAGFLQRKLLFAFYLIVTSTYFSWRFTVFNTQDPVFSTLFLLAEIISLILALMTIRIMWKIKVRPQSKAPNGLEVVVFVPTYNESRHLVRRTVIAAMNIDYPHETWLLDDGDRPEMKQLAEELGCNYLRRDTNEGAKPGNLNNALKYTNADFIAVIDCDHIAQTDYLNRLLGYFDDPKVAFVQAPQDYYNTNAFQFRNNPKFGLLWHDQTGFFSTGQAGRDYCDATTCCGTSTIVRRSVIDEIGGFPEETVTEDIHVAIKAQKLGYKSAYYPLPLAYGVSPVDLKEFQRQRLRWGQGNVQSVKEEALPFTKKLTFGQNIGYSYLGFLYAEGWARLLFYLAPPTVIFTGIMPIAPTHDFLWYFLPFFIITVLFFEQLGRGDNRFHVNEEMAMARFPAFIASTFAVFRHRIKWVVSSKEFIGHFQPYLLAPQLGVLLLNVSAVIWAIISPNQQLIQDYSIAMFAFGAMWCVFNSVLAIQVVRNSIRCAKNKRADFRFELQLPIRISVDNSQLIPAETVKISATGMSVTLDSVINIKPDSTLHGQIYMPGLSIPFQAKVEQTNSSRHTSVDNKQLLHCLFTWESEVKRDSLDLALHACVWHRRLLWDGEYFLTPLEKIATLIGLRKETRPLMKNHRAVLYQSVGTADQKLGLMLTGKDEYEHSFVAFEPMELPTTLKLDFFQNNSPVKTTIKLEELIIPEEVASAGPNRVKMYTYGANKGQ